MTAARAHARLLEYDAFLYENYEVLNHPIGDLVGMSTRALIHCKLSTRKIQG